MDLAEAVNHAVDAKIRRARRPHRTQRCAGKHGDDGVGDVGHETGNPVADANAAGLERGGQGGHLPAQFSVGDAHGAAIFAAKAERHALVVEAQQVLREVQPHIREPARAGHLVGIHQHRCALTAGLDPTKIPDQGPEPFGLANREVIQRGVPVQVTVVAQFLTYETHETQQIGPLDTLLARAPDWLVHWVGVPGLHRG